MGDVRYYIIYSWGRSRIPAKDDSEACGMYAEVCANYRAKPTAYAKPRKVIKETREVLGEGRDYQ